MSHSTCVMLAQGIMGLLGNSQSNVTRRDKGMPRGLRAGIGFPRQVSLGGLELAEIQLSKGCSPVIRAGFHVLS